MLKYHKHEDPSHPGPDGSRIVGFEVEPFSVNHKYKPPWNAARPALTTCSPIHPVTSVGNLEPQALTEATEIIWTYDVKWEWSDVRWASRWDLYMHMSDDQVSTTVWPTNSSLLLRLYHHPSPSLNLGQRIGVSPRESHLTRAMYTLSRSTGSRSSTPCWWSCSSPGWWR